MSFLDFMPRRQNHLPQQGQRALTPEEDLPVDADEVSEVLRRGRALNARGIQIQPERPEVTQDVGARWECQACDLVSVVCASEGEAVHLGEEHDRLHHGVRARQHGLAFLTDQLRIRRAA